MAKAQTDIRRTSYDVRTATGDGYQGTIDEVLEQIRAQVDVPPRAITAREELLDYLGVDTGGSWSWMHEDDSVVYGAPEAEELPFFSLANAERNGWLTEPVKLAMELDPSN